MLQQLKNAHQARRNQKGFTLIELLLVIVILGVLSGIVVFAVSGITDRGNAAACKTDWKTVQVASEAFRAKNGTYAGDIDALVTAGLLRGAPGNNGYTISYDSATGKVTAGIVAGHQENTL